MTEKIKFLLSQLKSKEYKEKRRHAKNMSEIDCRFHDSVEKYTADFKKVIEAEIPLLFENDMFGFNRSIDCVIPALNGNVTPNYYRVITQGFDEVCKQIEESILKTNDKDKIAYGKSMLNCIDALCVLVEKYKSCAEKSGNARLYNALLKIPHSGAESFYEACVFMKICIFFLRTSFASHVGLGRFDQYMYPFYMHDKQLGIGNDEIFEILEAFFISINYDTDLYVGVQRGDNGQSMTLGGFDKDGTSMYNELSKMCMKASLELNIIDPKINLRVGKSTPDELYEYGTLLTKQGLGFPQYCNDDVVIDGLVKLGYDYDDAINYVTAACWEYIIPNCGADIPNIDVMDFPNTINRAVSAHLSQCNSFDELMKYVKQDIADECNRIIESHKASSEPLIPVLSMFIDGCIEKLTDMLHGGAKYHNFGCHGTGIANAADALCAIKKNIYDDKSITKSELLHALANNFEGCNELRNILINTPKMGSNDAYVDSIAYDIMDCFATNMNSRDTQVGGIWRAGTGSAMEYLWKGHKCPATCDGRKAYQPYSANFSPAPGAKTPGLLSVIQSFTGFDMTNIINGGPLTVEIHDTVLRNDVGIQKVAMLVKKFIHMGGHQLQLNSINREQLLAAQKHPEDYPNLIVRVWGWSGYFNELDMDYQKHIINRAEYMS